MDKLTYPRPSPEPIQRQGSGSYPRIIRQTPQRDGTVLVTFSLPGLKRATVRVPVGAWSNGEHLRLHEPLAALADRRAPVPPRP